MDTEYFSTYLVSAKSFGKSFNDTDMEPTYFLAIMQISIAMPHHFTQERWGKVWQAEMGIVHGHRDPNTNTEIAPILG